MDKARSVVIIKIKVIIDKYWIGKQSKERLIWSLSWLYWWRLSKINYDLWFMNKLIEKNDCLFCDPWDLSLSLFTFLFIWQLESWNVMLRIWSECSHNLSLLETKLLLFESLIINLKLWWKSWKEKCKEKDLARFLNFPHKTWSS